MYSRGKRLTHRTKAIISAASYQVPLALTATGSYTACPQVQANVALVQHQGFIFRVSVNMKYSIICDHGTVLN